MTAKYGKTTIFADVLTANSASEKILVNCGFKMSYPEEITHIGSNEIIHHYKMSDKPAITA